MTKVAVQPLAVAECPVCGRLEIVDQGTLRRHGAGGADDWWLCNGSGQIPPQGAILRYQLAVVDRPEEPAGG